MLFGKSDEAMKRRSDEGAGSRAKTAPELSTQHPALGTFVKEYPHPFRNCIVLGLIQGEDGKKLSKRLRNYKDPGYIFDHEGADAMRWSLLSAQAPWTNVRFQEEAIATDQREFLIRLYNVYSFFVIYANIDGFNPAEVLPAPSAPAPRDPPARAEAERTELDRWILSELHATIRDVRSAMDRYENYPAAQRLIAFVDALSNWYVRRSRARFWKSQMDADKRAAYTTLWTCLEQVCRLAAPFVPFFTEALYQNLVRRPFRDKVPESIHLCDYPQADQARIDERLSAEMAWGREIASLGRAARTEAMLKVRQPLARVEVVLADPYQQAWLESHAPLIAEELNVKAVEFATDADRYVSYAVKPNFKSIGPKFGKLAPQIQKTLAAADAAALRRQLDANGKLAMEVAGQPVELTPDDVQITLSAKSGWAAAQGRSAVVVLATEITPELRLEGLARELIHEIQARRSDENLPYEARSRGSIEVDPATGRELLAAIEANRAYILGETLGTELHVNAKAPAGAKLYTVEVEGVGVKLAIPRAT